MGSTDNTRRVQFTLPASLVDAIDEYCEKAHMSRSTYVEYTLANTISSTQRLLDSVTQSVITQSALAQMAGRDEGE